MKKIIFSAAFLLTAALSFILLCPPLITKSDVHQGVVSFQSSAHSSVLIRTLISDKWETVCAFTNLYGRAAARTPLEKSALQTIFKNYGAELSEYNWTLAVFSAGKDSPALYSFSRNRVPLVEGPLAAKLNPGIQFSGTPVVCTADKNATLEAAFEPKGGAKMLSLTEPLKGDK